MTVWSTPPRWTLHSTGLSRSALWRAGVFPLNNTVWAPWTVVAVVTVVASLLGEESQVNLMEKHLSCCLFPAQHGSPSGGKRPLPSAEGWASSLPCPFPWSKWEDSFDISVFDFSAWNESAKDGYRTVSLLTELQEVSELWGRDTWGFLCPWSWLWAAASPETMKGAAMTQVRDPDGLSRVRRILLSFLWSKDPFAVCTDHIGVEYLEFA